MGGGSGTDHDGQSDRMTGDMRKVNARTGYRNHHSFPGVTYA